MILITGEKEQLVSFKALLSDLLSLIDLEIYDGGIWRSLVCIQKSKRYIYVIKKRWLKTKTDVKTI